MALSPALWGSRWNRLTALVVLCGLLAHRAVCFRSGLPRPAFSPRPLRVSSIRMLSQEIEGGTIDLLYDSECPVCMMEVEFLRKRDIEGKIRFTDLNDPDYDPKDHGNVKFSEGMRKIRAVLPDNTVVSGVEVFRRVYSAIGLGWMFEMTNVPIIGRVADAMYDIWAENRLRITGRGDLADKLREKSAELRAVGEVVCDDQGCSLEDPSDEEDPSCPDDGCALVFDDE